MNEFIKIFEIKENVKGCLNIIQVVDQRNLTEQEYEDLIEYFNEVTPTGEDMSESANATTFHLVNSDEQLENSPLPDGTIIYSSSFKEYGNYAVVIGETDDNRIEVTLQLEL